MITVTINNKEYKLKFTYRVMCKTNLIDDITSVMNGGDTTFRDIASTLPELMLAGLRKYHSEFKWNTEKEKEKALDKVFDLLDDYEDESEDKTVTYKLYKEMVEELMDKGFLSGLLNSQEEAEVKEKIQEEKAKIVHI